MPSNATRITLVETPRDAFQGLPKLIPTSTKIAYIQSLLEAGFKHLDIGSFVSPKAVPQMADSEDVARAVCGDASVEFIAIVANAQGVSRALNVEGIDTLAFPFSLSDTFQRRNTNKGIDETWPAIDEMLTRIGEHGRHFLIYISMAFGNPYEDPCSLETLKNFITRLATSGVQQISLADTVGVAEPLQVKATFEALLSAFPKIDWSAHFHGRPDDWHHNILAALEGGCRRFDGAVGGLGGCPFAYTKDKLVSNVPTEGLVQRFEQLGYPTGIDPEKLARSSALANEINNRYGGSA